MILISILYYISKKKIMKKILLRIIAYWPLMLILVILWFIIIDLLNWEKFGFNYFHIIFMPIWYLLENVINPFVEYLNEIDRLLKYWVYMLFIGLTWHLFIKNIPSWIFKFFIIVLSILKAILKIFFWFLFKEDNFVILLNTYLNFLNHYVNEWNLSLILKAHKMFFSNIWNNLFTIPNDKIVVFKTYFEDRNMVILLNYLIQRHINKDSYVRKTFKSYERYKFFYIAKKNLTSKDLEKKILNVEDEIINNFGWDYNLRVKSENKIDVKVELIKKNLWDNKEIDLNSMKLKKWEVLFWFYSEVTNKWVTYKNRTLFTDSILHSFIIWSTRSGKDQALLNQTFSYLYNVKHYQNLELDFFDTKQSDWVYLDNLSSYWIRRHTNLEDYVNILERLESEMNRRQMIVWISSNIYWYNKSNPKSKMKERVIIVNELLSLYTSLEKDKLQKISWHLNNILAKWAWVGFKVILMSQTLRKDLSSSISKFLVNIQSKIILKINNPDEIEIVSRWASRKNYSRIKSLLKYNCLYFEDFEIKSEFKAYYFNQEDILEWVNRNFEKIDIFHDSKINDYYRFALWKWELSMQKAMWVDFKLTRKNWDNMIVRLSADWKIEREVGWKYYFKK